MDSLTELFCLIDDFCLDFEPEWQQHLLEHGQSKRLRSTSLSLSELMTLIVLFHQLRYRQFKLFYNEYALRFLRSEFPNLPSYSRSVRLMPRCVIPFAALFHLLKGECTGISIADSTPVKVCHNLRIRNHRVFAGVAARAKVQQVGFMV